MCESVIKPSKRDGGPISSDATKVAGREGRAMGGFEVGSIPAEIPRLDLTVSGRPPPACVAHRSAGKKPFAIVAVLCRLSATSQNDSDLDGAST